MLAAGPVITIDPLAFAFDGEPFLGSIEIATNTARLPPTGTFTLGNPLLLLGLVDANAELRLSKALAQRIATTALMTQIESGEALSPEQLEYMAEAQGTLMLTMLASQGVLLEDGDDYRTTVQFADGVLTLNGNPLPFGL